MLLSCYTHTAVFQYTPMVENMTVYYAVYGVYHSALHLRDWHTDTSHAVCTLIIGMCVVALYTRPQHACNMVRALIIDHIHTMRMNTQSIIIIWPHTCMHHTRPLQLCVASDTEYTNN